MINKITFKIFIAVLLMNFSLNAQIDETQATSAEDLAKQLANPVASISVPFQIILTLMLVLLKV
jgi:hypothetical protein